MQVFKYEHQRLNIYDKVEDGEAMFHQWGIDSQEHDNSTGNFTTAIIERDNGQVENVPAEMIQFLDKP